MTDYIKCKNCGGKVNDAPPKCPYCGIKDPVPGMDASHYFGIVAMSSIVLIALFGLYSCMHESPEEKQRKAAAEAQEIQKAEDHKRKGFHCLSGWDGSNSDVVRYVKQNLKDPSSFEHVATRITPMDESGAHKLLMTYRAKNSFGALVANSVDASVRNSNCSATIL